VSPTPSAQHTASKPGALALEYAMLFRGVKEQPAGSNHGPDVWRTDRRGKRWRGGIDYWCTLANGLHGGYPWCAAFATAAFRLTGRTVGDARRASVQYFEQWAKIQGDLVTRPFRGDLVCYDWNADNWYDHIGIVQRVLSLPAHGRPFLIRAIEGNTSLGNDSNGGQVMLRTRWASHCRFVRIPDHPPHT
jgi:CHAP domain